MDICSGTPIRPIVKGLPKMAESLFAVKNMNVIAGISYQPLRFTGRIVAAAKFIAGTRRANLPVLRI